MAKDPAFLFYANDFDSKTKFFSHEQVGMYLRLLIAQFQIGRLTEEQVLFICKRYDKDILSKFTKDENGLYFNERLELESIKRKKYSQSRRENRLKKDNKIESYDTSYVSHMENTLLIDNNKNNIVSKNSNLNRQPNIPTKEQVWEVFQRSGGTKEMAKSFYEKYESVGWITNTGAVTNFVPLATRFISTWKTIEDDKKKKNEPFDPTKVKLKF
jgi:uncharacterized protein YdaU (DUF1376 family)